MPIFRLGTVTAQVGPIVLGQASQQMQREAADHEATMRAWREASDGLPAGAAAFDQRWARGEDCALARRVRITGAALLRAIAGAEHALHGRHELPPP